MSDDPRCSCCNPRYFGDEFKLLQHQFKERVSCISVARILEAYPGARFCFGCHTCFVNERSLNRHLGTPVHTREATLVHEDLSYRSRKGTFCSVCLCDVTPNHARLEHADVAPLLEAADLAPPLHLRSRTSSLGPVSSDVAVAPLLEAAELAPPVQLPSGTSSLGSVPSDGAPLFFPPAAPLLGADELAPPVVDETEESQMVPQVSQKRQCDKCQFWCDPSNMARHQRSHGDEKPHECRICRKTFARSDTLKGHLRTHNFTSMKVMLVPFFNKNVRLCVLRSNLVGPGYVCHCIINMSNGTPVCIVMLSRPCFVLR